MPDVLAAERREAYEVEVVSKREKGRQETKSGVERVEVRKVRQGVERE